MNFLSGICTLSVLHFVYAIKLGNNACPKLSEYPVADLSSHCYHDPDVLSDIPSVGVHHGYEIDTFNVTTPDGYIITLFRVNPKNAATKGIVYLQHGIIVNAGLWVAGNISLGITFAERGYEVWLGGFRGTTYSQTSLKYSYYDPKFWDFGLDELTEYDLLTQLEFVSNTTGRNDLIYVGHSMGTTTVFMLAASQPEKIQNLIQGVVALAPVVYLKDMLLLELGGPLLEFLYMSKLGGIPFQEFLVHETLVELCRLLPDVCVFVLRLFAGHSVQVPSLFPPEVLLIGCSYWPTSTSFKTLYHYYQIHHTDQFKKFDFGKTKNLEKYGKETPPKYDLGKIKLPVYLFYGKNDATYSAESLNKLYFELGSKTKYKQSVPKYNDTDAFNHVDFVYSIGIQQNLYEDLFAIVDHNFMRPFIPTQ